MAAERPRGEVAGDDRKPRLARAASDRPEAERDREESEGERREDSDTAGERAHENHTQGEAESDQDHLGWLQRPDQPAPLERTEAVALVLARAHESPRSGGGSGGRGR